MLSHLTLVPDAIDGSPSPATAGSGHISLEWLGSLTAPHAEVDALLHAAVGAQAPHLPTESDTVFEIVVVGQPMHFDISLL